MPLPLVFIGVAAATGVTGIGTSIKAGFDQHTANTINNDANRQIEEAVNNLEIHRRQCGEALQNLGEEKLFVLRNGISEFVEHFRQIKNVDFSGSEGIMELKKLKLDKKDFEELEDMSVFTLSLVEGAVTGSAGGALIAAGAWGAAGQLASASTGTAIASLSGAAAHNATLAFFGGGAKAVGGLGMAGGAGVLAGLVAGPALMFFGLYTGAKAGENLEKAYGNKAKAEEICEELKTGAKQCIAIRRRTYMLYSLLAKLDAYLYPLNQEMKRIISTEGTDYSTYKLDSKKSIAAVVSTVASIKAVLDTAILNENGELTDESEEVVLRSQRNIEI